MSALGFLLLLVIAGVCGSIGRSIVGYSHGGCLVSVALGFIGAVIGVWLARAVGLPSGMFSIDIDGKAFPIVWSILGAALFVAVLNLISRRRAA
jgi:uncharacterized membrane protein YeaQ/YmgE (transglycosylase-associated protein family)